MTRTVAMKPHFHPDLADLTSGVWYHVASGKGPYTVLTVANSHAEDRPGKKRDEVQVVYAGTDGRVWSRPLAEFREKMKLAPYNTRQSA